MLETKKRTANRESGQLTKRLKSNLGEKQMEQEGQEETSKPQSALRVRRPASAVKPSTQSAKTIAALPVSKPEFDVRPILSVVFQHGPKLRDFLREKKLNKEVITDRITNDGLFSLRLMSMLREQPQDTWNDIAQQQCIAKISKMLFREDLLKRCEQCELRVGSMLEERLRKLERR